MVANFRLMPDNSNKSNNVLAFLQETFEMLKGNMRSLFRADNWNKVRRIVVMKQKMDIRLQAPGKLLFPDEEVYRNYRYTAYVNSSKLSSVLVWELYRRQG